MPTTTPPASAAPLEAASMTPPKPPEQRAAPARATAAPTRRARAAVRLEHVPSPITPMCTTAGIGTSGDLDYAGLDLLEAVGDERVVAGDDQLLLAGEGVDGLEGLEHLGQVGDDLHGLARLHVVVEVRGIRREDDRAALGLDADDLEPRGVPAHAVHAEPGEDFAVAVEETDAVAVVEPHEPRERVDVRRAAEGRRVAVLPGAEGGVFLLDPELGVGEEAVPRPVVVVEMRDEREAHVGRLDARALHHRGGRDVVAHAARPRLIVEEARVHEDRLGPAKDQPDEIVQRELVVRRLAVEELALRRVAFGVLERVDLVHGFPPPGPGVYYGCGVRSYIPTFHRDHRGGARS